MLLLALLTFWDPSAEPRALLLRTHRFGSKRSLSGVRLVQTWRGGGCPPLWLGLRSFSKAHPVTSVPQQVPSPPGCWPAA